MGTAVRSIRKEQIGGEPLEISINVWGDLACFTMPGNKVERLTYPFPTPSAARGILSAIYSKPSEFFWEIRRIEVLSPIRYISFKRNEVKVKVSNKSISAEDERTQRQTTALCDVRYRIVAEIVPRENFGGTARQLYEQAMRRIRGGKCYYQPSFGLREFVAYFEEDDGTHRPIAEDMDIGWMVYDIFDLNDSSVSKKVKPCLSLFHAVMKQGVIEIPRYDSPDILRGE